MYRNIYVQKVGESYLNEEVTMAGLKMYKKTKDKEGKCRAAAYQQRALMYQVPQLQPEYKTAPSRMILQRLLRRQQLVKAVNFPIDAPLWVTHWGCT